MTNDAGEVEAKSISEGMHIIAVCVISVSVSCLSNRLMSCYHRRGHVPENRRNPLSQTPKEDIHFVNIISNDTGLLLVITEQGHMPKSGRSSSLSQTPAVHIPRC